MNQYLRNQGWTVQRHGHRALETLLFWLQILAVDEPVTDYFDLIRKFHTGNICDESVICRRQKRELQTCEYEIFYLDFSCTFSFHKCQ